MRSAASALSQESQLLLTPIESSNIACLSLGRWVAEVVSSNSKASLSLEGDICTINPCQMMDSDSAEFEL